MPAPPNMTPGTATVIPSLPYSIALDVQDAPGFTHEVWFKYVAVAGEIEMGVLSYADPTSEYVPLTTIFSPDEFTQAFAGFGRTPAAFPIVAGETYYFRVRQQFGHGEPLGALLEFSVVPGPVLDARTGDLLVPDESEPFHASVLDPLIEEVRRYADLPAGEVGSILDNGVFALFEDIGGDDYVSVFDTDFSLLGQFSPTPLPIIQISHDATQFYYAASTGVALSQARIGTVTAAGIDGGQTWDLPIGTGFILGMAPSLDGSILYYCLSNSSIIRQYDLTNDLPLSDFAAALAGHLPGPHTDILVLSDDTVLFPYRPNGVNTYVVIHYAADGSILHTYDFGTDPLNRLATAVDNPNSFWCWFRISGRDIFKEINISDGAVISSVSYPEFNLGVGPLYTVEPYLSGEIPRFGPSRSCPFLVLRAPDGTGEEPTGTIIVLKFADPSNGTSFPFTASGGLDPDEFELEDGGSQTYLDVPVGSGYGIAEIVPPGWAVAYEVSNASPIDDISVGEDEVVIVTVTNTLTGPELPTDVPIVHILAAQLIPTWELERFDIKHRQEESIAGVIPQPNEGIEPDWVDRGQNWILCRLDITERREEIA